MLWKVERIDRHCDRTSGVSDQSGVTAVLFDLPIGCYSQSSRQGFMSGFNPCKTFPVISACLELRDWDRGMIVAHGGFSAVNKNPVISWLVDWYFQNHFVNAYSRQLMWQRIDIVSDGDVSHDLTHSALAGHHPILRHLYHWLINRY